MNVCDDDDSSVIMISGYFYLCILLLWKISHYAAATGIGIHRRLKQNNSIGFIYFLIFLPSDMSFNNLSYVAATLDLTQSPP